jgi:hypothetical protein
VKDKKNWRQFLHEHGTVVIKGALSPKQVEKARGLYWDKIESLKIPAAKRGLDRNDISTWGNENWPSSVSGLTTCWGVTQSEAAWYIRTNPKVVEAFSHIWDSQDLITSMDCFLTWRPWWYNKSVTKNKLNENWMPTALQLHPDQNPCENGFSCVQGMVPLYDVTE